MAALDADSGLVGLLTAEGIIEVYRLLTISPTLAQPGNGSAESWHAQAVVVP